MKLNVLERLILLNILPREGSFTNLKLIRVAREALSFTDEENKDLQFSSTKEGALQWKTAGNAEKEVELGEVVTQIIVKELKDMDSKEKLTDEHMSLYEKFIQ